MGSRPDRLAANARRRAAHAYATAITAPATAHAATPTPHESHAVEPVPSIHSPCAGAPRRAPPPRRRVR